MTPARVKTRRGFLCAACQSEELVVIDSRWSNARAAIWRRRACRQCGARETYYETRAGDVTRPSARRYHNI